MKKIIIALSLVFGVGFPTLNVHAHQIVATNKTFIFKVKTKSGGIVGNIRISADNLFAAITKLKKRYPDCEILEAKEA